MRILGRKSVIIADLERYESREQRLNALLRPQITEAGPKTPSRRPGGNRVAAPGCAASYRRNAETRASAVSSVHDHAPVLGNVEPFPVHPLVVLSILGG